MHFKYPHLHDVTHLGCVQRILHPNSRKHIFAVSCGTVVMMTGSFIATHAGLFPFPHLIVDSFGYFLHGIGAMPIYFHIEPFWVVLSGVKK